MTSSFTVAIASYMRPPDCLPGEHIQQATVISTFIIQIHTSSTCDQTHGCSGFNDASPGKSTPEIVTLFGFRSNM